MPKISVQIPVYNSEKYLQQCLESIENQTFKDFEVICVNDGSTDRSLSILQKVSSKDSRFRVIDHGENKGTLQARKTAFQEATGEFIAFVDADDLAKPRMLERLYKRANNTGSDFVQCCASIYDPERMLSNDIIDGYDLYFSNIEDCSKTGKKIFESYGNGIKNNFWISFFKRDVYKTVLPYIPEASLPHGNDNLVMFMLLYFSKRFCTLNEILYLYRANANSSNLIIPSVEKVKAHIKSRSEVVIHARNFLLKVAPEFDEECEPFVLLKRKTYNYTKTLLERCLSRNGEARKELYDFLDQSFTLNGYKHPPYSRYSKQLGSNYKNKLENQMTSAQSLRQKRLTKLKMVKSIFKKVVPRTIRRVVRKTWYRLLIPAAMSLGRVPYKIYKKLPQPIKKSGRRVWYKAIVPITQAPRYFHDYYTIGKSGLFFPEYYALNLPMVKNPLLHYVRIGAKKVKNPSPLFDARWYSNSFLEKTTKKVNPLVHYIKFGWKLGFSPSPDFNINEYFSEYPDVKERNIEPLGHFYKYGSLREITKPINEVSLFDLKTRYLSSDSLVASQRHFTTIVKKSTRGLLKNLNGKEKYAQKSNIKSNGNTFIPEAKFKKTFLLSEKLNRSFKPTLKLSTKDELELWSRKHFDFLEFREQVLGYSESNLADSNLKLIQDLAICNFIRRHLKQGAKVLEIGGGLSRILSFFSDEIEAWNLDKFEGAGNGPKEIPSALPYKVIPNYIGSFDNELPSEYFDLVFSISVIEHINEDDAVLQNIVNDINRLLKTGGFNVHCIDCRFPPSRRPNMSNRKLALFMTEYYGFTANYIYDTYLDEEVFTMSGNAYDRFWKQSCKNRPHELDGLPFNIFLSTIKDKSTNSSVNKNNATIVSISTAQDVLDNNINFSKSNIGKSPLISVKKNDAFLPDERNVQKNRKKVLLANEKKLVNFFNPTCKLSTNEELTMWYEKHSDFVKFREQMQGYSESDYMNSNLKFIQDLSLCDFIRKNIHQGAKVLEIGGGRSRILSFFNEEFEGWNLDKFEGVGNGPKEIPEDSPYKVVSNYIGSFDTKLPDKYFDLVFSISVVEHINEAAEVLKNVVDDIDRLLKIGGFNVHCIDCRFPPAKQPNMSNRKLALFMVEHYGFSAQYIYDNFKKDEIFTMSGVAYDRFWKKSCGDRPHEVDGLPFNIFLAVKKDC